MPLIIFDKSREFATDYDAMKPSRNSTLDTIRAIAALEVMFSHLRSFLFKDFAQLPDPNALVKLFYYFTGFGHQAVVLFFVLSGYLVGGSVITAKYDGFWMRYSVQRISRLWIVLLPCLAATFFWNTLGQNTGGTPFLSGCLNPPIGSAPFEHWVHIDLETFFGNAFFLQTIVTPIFGDNGPLWSLANEFWYYVIFPLVFWGLNKGENRSLSTRILFLAAASVLLLFLPRGIVVGFAIWILGAFIFAARKSTAGNIMDNIWFGLPCLVACLALFHYSRVATVHDLWLGLAFSAALPLLLRIPPAPKLFSAATAGLSDFSFTLYLAHFSLAAFIWYSLLGAQRLEPSIAAALRFVCVAIALLVYSFGLFLIFERNTDRLRRYVMGKLLSKPERARFIA